MLAGTDPVVLEINTIPGMRRTGNLALAAEAAGLSYEDLVRMVLHSAADRPKYRREHVSSRRPGLPDLRRNGGSRPR
jgi:hypothetical protein